MFTPNEKYAALFQMAGYVPVALSAGDYIELLPATWRAVNAYGVKVSHLGGTDWVVEKRVDGLRVAPIERK